MAVRGRAAAGRGWLVIVAATAAALSCGKSSGSKPNGGGDGGGGGSPRAATAGGKPPVSVEPAAGAGASLGPAGANQAGDGGAAGGPASEADAGAAGASDEIACDALCQALVGQASDFGTPWQSSWFLMGCTSLQSDDTMCVVTDHCPNQAAATFDGRGTATLETFPIGGDAGQNYKVTFEFNAIAGAKEFSGGSPDVNDPTDGTVDGFYRDGEPIPSNYDSWRLGVFDENGVEVRHYFMNSTSPGVLEQHATYRFSYTKSIVVVGGGKLTHRIHDPNCVTPNNCVLGQDSCQVAYYLPNEPLAQPLPAVYQDPLSGQLKPLHELSFLNPAPAQQPWHSQLGHLTVISAEPTTDPVTVDY